MEKNTIIIFTANKARELLKDGFKVVDIKPDKTDSDGKRSVFVFEYADGRLRKQNNKTRDGNSCKRVLSLIYY